MSRRLNVVQEGLPRAATVILEPGDGDLMDMRLRGLLRAWTSAKFKNKGRLPAKGDLAEGAVRAAADFCVDIEIAAGGELAFLSYGRGIARAFGRDMTGRRVSDLPKADAIFFKKVYFIAGSKRIACATEHAPSATVPVGRWMRLVLPMDETGKGNATHFLACNVPIDTKDTVDLPDDPRAGR